MAERLFNDQSAPMAPGLLEEAGFAELLGHDRELARRCGKIEEGIAVAAQLVGDGFVGLGLLELAREIMSALEEPVDVAAAAAALELLHALAQVIAESILADVARSDAEQAEV